MRAQLLDADRAGDVVEVAEELGAIKFDPTATIAPAEHTILWSRLGAAYDQIQLSKAVDKDRLLFEFDGSFRPVSLLPLMLPAMRHWPRRESSREWLAANDSSRTDVLARLPAEGPLLATEIPDSGLVDAGLARQVSRSSASYGARVTMPATARASSEFTVEGDDRIRPEGRRISHRESTRSHKQAVHR